MNENASDIRATCLSRSRLDTHAHLNESYGGLAEGATNWASFATTRAMHSSRAAAEACRVLYGEDAGVFLRPDSSQAAFDKAAALREKGAWGAIEHAMDVVGIKKQIAFCGFKPKDTRPFAGIAGNRLAYLAYIDEVINGEDIVPSPDYPELSDTYYNCLCKQLGPLPTLDSYLADLDAEIDQWRSHGVVGMKTAMAYTWGLKVSDPTERDARRAFSKKNDMTFEDRRIVHDFAFHHILAACRRNEFPVVVHTGYQNWGHGSLCQTNPMEFHNVLVDRRYRDMTFVLLHGGNPYVGETSYLAGMFENVIIDFTWIGWVTPLRFKHALAEWLAMVPHDRMCWGSDSSYPEDIAGVDRLTRQLIADVLEDAIEARIIDETYAREFIDRSYYENPRRIFGLEDV
ncbi:MAG: amidohydrolase family protein [Lentisphaerae bacterium]|nr:amidohydrolase family protein [Lentisphaerota bacterium]MBT5607412.1 amidohydrolase family protein [Lentisphaerota bacterium]MBT7056120.1 amidohydrolase family protein [Lentisphaerota bacterium]MBT7841358.1 amidohydrolase family protein [Lentisphaerota bacterium]